MIVITDGESHDSPDLEKVIEDSEKDNVTRYAVAVSGGEMLSAANGCKTSRRTRGNGLKLHQGRSRLDIRENVFLARVGRHWTRLPRALGESPSLEGFKNHVDVALGDVV